MDNFSIINDAGVDEDLLRNIIDQSGIVSGQILLRLMDGYLPDNAAGSTIPRSLLKYAHDFHIFDEFIDLEWEIAIAISGKYCLRTKSFPAYFSYLLGQELMLPRNSGHRVKPQEVKFHTPAGLHNESTNDVFFGCKRFQCNKTGLGSLLTCYGTDCG